MRQIKFRGKRVDNGEWVHGYLFVSRFVDAMKERLAVMIQVLDDMQYNCFEVIPESVGQFTGLHDKHGKEIFEGDILSRGSTSSGTLIAWKVVYHFDGFKIQDFEERRRPSQVNKGFWQRSEIIGNIHEHKHLLK